MASPLLAIFSFFALLVAVYAIDVSTLSYSPDDLLSEKRLISLFDRWNAAHGKQYGNGETEAKRRRFEIFRTNLRYIDAHNKKDSTYRLGLNRFADLTNEEFRARHLGFKGDAARKRLRRAGKHTLEIPRSTAGIPAAFDWRKEGVVTPIKDQGQCGSCWAFSSTGAIEGVNAITTGSLISLSEQELVDCDRSGFSEGCSGGLMDDAFQWVIDNGGIASEKSYSYKSFTGIDGVCNNKLKAEKVVTIDDYVDVPPYSDEALLYAASQQPISVAIDGSAYDFQLYSEGLFTGYCSDDPYDTDHAVLIVGWGSENGLDYWIVKNSWGESWGIDGYIHMVRNGSPFGICAINTMASYPVKTAGSSGLTAKA